MKREIERRLVALEEAGPSRSASAGTSWTKLLFCVVGLLIGKAEEHEALADGAMRAASCATTVSIRAGLTLSRFFLWLSGSFVNFLTAITGAPPLQRLSDWFRRPKRRHHPGWRPSHLPQR